MLILNTYIFLLGITLGSFYNVVGLRVPEGKSIVRPRSACPGCQHELTALELVPVLSYMMQGGKCKNCRSKISPLYPIVEFLTGALFVLSFHVFGWSVETIVACTLVSLCIIITVSDLAYMIIPDKVLVVFLVLFVAERIWMPLAPWWDSAVGAVAGFGLLFIIALVSRGGMGGGDIKLYGVLGIVLGWKVTLLSFFLATLFGAIIGGVGMIGGKVKRGKPMPFGPFIVMGTLLAYFYGTRILNWYWSFVL
ncbi:prepilin peptidase [Priestia koreensis]|uniref:prepilin peptidase n=1 Tax=Priestia koreensis TaxID=284581 RepID=UPI00301A7102